MWSVTNACKECDKVIACDLGVINNNTEQEAKDRCNVKCDKVIKINERIKKKLDTIKVKGKEADDKEEGVVRLFSPNCNGFGPHSEGKIEKTKEMSKLRNINGLKISSSDARWNVKNEIKMVHRLKCE